MDDPLTPFTGTTPLDDAWRMFLADTQRFGGKGIPPAFARHRPLIEAALAGPGAEGPACGHAAITHNEFGCFVGNCPCETPERDIVHGGGPTDG
jgi:hypothetical protein